MLRYFNGRSYWEGRSARTAFFSYRLGNLRDLIPLAAILDDLLLRRTSALAGRKYIYSRPAQETPIKLTGYETLGATGPNFDSSGYIFYWDRLSDRPRVVSAGSLLTTYLSRNVPVVLLNTPLGAWDSYYEAWASIFTYELLLQCFETETSFVRRRHRISPLIWARHPRKKLKVSIGGYVGVRIEHVETLTVSKRKLPTEEDSPEKGLTAFEVLPTFELRIPELNYTNVKPRLLDEHGIPWRVDPALGRLSTANSFCIWTTCFANTLGGVDRVTDRAGTDFYQTILETLFAFDALEYLDRRSLAVAVRLYQTNQYI
mgnify:FL=1